MDSKHQLEKARIDAPDWEATPVSVRNLVVQLVGKVEQLEQRLQELEIENEQLKERIHQNSRNSHSPPASDPPKVEKVKTQKSTGKKRGGQPGHQGFSRPLYRVEECSLVRDYYPQTCTGCGEPLWGEDPKPYRHQVVEMKRGSSKEIPMGKTLMARKLGCGWR